MKALAIRWILAFVLAAATTAGATAAEPIEVNACFPTGTDSNLTARKQECIRKLEQYKEVRQKALAEKERAVSTLRERQSEKQTGKNSFAKLEKEHKRQVARLSQQIEFCLAAEAHLTKNIEELDARIAAPSGKSSVALNAITGAPPQVDFAFPKIPAIYRKEDSGRSVITNSAELVDSLFADKQLTLPLVRISNPKSEWVEVWTPRNISLNLKGRRGDAVTSAAAGLVVFAGQYSLSGNVVIIQHHKHHLTLYGHLDKALVERGQTVTQGQEIGRLGHSGYSIGDSLVFRIQDER